MPNFRCSLVWLWCRIHLNAPVHSNHHDYYHCNLCAHVPKIDWPKEKTESTLAFYMMSLTKQQQQQQHSIDNNISDSIYILWDRAILLHRSKQIICLFSTYGISRIWSFYGCRCVISDAPHCAKQTKCIQIGFEINTTKIADGDAMYCFKNNHTQ